MSSKTYFLETFGCQMNILDSQLIAGQLHAMGLQSVDRFDQADVILFNTCSVRQHAEDKVHARLGELRKLKQRRPEAVVGVLGCMAEREKEGVFVKAPHVDLLCGPGELNKIPSLLAEVWERHERVSALAGSLSRRTEVFQRALEYDSLEALDLSRAPSLEGRVLQSYIRVQRGCDKFCTYCVVPFTRGPERSRPAEHIVDEARMLVERGCREVTLLGQTVNSYVHQDDGKPVRFAELLERVQAVDGIDRVRFVTSYPADWDSDIFRVMRDCPKITPYLHIPAQSGSDAVLRRMKRGYTVSSYLELMDEARARLPRVALAGDIIVGFCGETEAEFEETIRLVRGVEYQQLYVFRYSPRPGTAADRNLVDDVPEEVKAARNTTLLDVQTEISRKLRLPYIGREVEVLIEGFSKLARKSRGETKGQVRTRGKASPSFRAGAPVLPESEQDRGAEVSVERSSQLVGRTSGDLVVLFDAVPELIGAIARVYVESASSHSLMGRITEVISPARSQPSGPADPRRRELPILR